MLGGGTNSDGRGTCEGPVYIETLGLFFFYPKKVNEYGVGQLGLETLPGESFNWNGGRGEGGRLGSNVEGRRGDLVKSLAGVLWEKKWLLPLRTVRRCNGSRKLKLLLVWLFTHVLSGWRTDGWTTGHTLSSRTCLEFRWGEAFTQQNFSCVDVCSR